MDSIDLILKPADGPGQLHVFLISRAGNEAFSVAIPPELGGLHQAWLRRFLIHHDPAGPDVPSAVVQDYGSRLSGAMKLWLRHSDWAPLQRVLDHLPGCPLRLRCEGAHAVD